VGICWVSSGFIFVNFIFGNRSLHSIKPLKNGLHQIWACVQFHLTWALILVKLATSCFILDILNHTAQDVAYRCLYLCDIILDKLKLGASSSGFGFQLRR
jgi:hypothetical protein